MRSSNVRSVSFTFHKNPSENQVEHKPSGKSENVSAATRRILQSSTRQRLQDRFDQECPYALSRDHKSHNRGNRSHARNWSDFNISLPSVQPRRMLRSGADKISKTIATVRNSIDTLSQRFRTSTRRRYRLENESPQAVTPRTRSRCILGRTPTKLYSPFGIETPQSGKQSNPDKENQSFPGKAVTPRRSLRQRASPYKSSWSKDKGSVFH
ncbi:Macrolide export ATP-binding/permease protein MacB [Frankliniella fusca]|uniref:Macrolide export ATP-binding/permease protein MacB n=1 Tax=Frankliniella fusca TaxID=407009 RepID=A0AAE1LB43_9NEOP|nr:Macrolide export ATP-binding/permease protein MacB [Frankliniella fusca]